MALVLTLHKNEDFYVGDQQIVVTEVYDDGTFVLQPTGGGEYDVTHHPEVEIMPNVYVIASDAPEHYGRARIVISAPREVVVILGDRYRKPTGKAAIALGG